MYYTTLILYFHIPQAMNEILRNFLNAIGPISKNKIQARKQSNKKQEGFK
jgi:hypothetical protein